MQKEAARKRANLRDVAEAAGVSVATVSRVMNTPDSVAKTTRARVEAAMAQLHWTPSAAARAINSGRTRFVGALVPTLDADIFARVIANLESQLATHGLSLVVATTGGLPQVEAQKAKALLDIGAEGLVVSGASHADDFYALIARSRLPAISTSWYEPEFVLPTVGYDNKAAALLALTHLTDLGHSRIAVLHGPLATNDRTGARVRALQAHTDQLSYHPAEMTIAGACAGAARLLDSDPATRPTAVMCMSDLLATGLIYECQRRGVQVPQDLSIISTDDLPASAHLVPALTTVHLPVDIMGQRAADAIAGWVEHHQRPADQLLDIALMVRDSTAPPRQ